MQGKVGNKRIGAAQFIVLSAPRTLGRAARSARPYASTVPLIGQDNRRGVGWIRAGVAC